MPRVEAAKAVSDVWAKTLASYKKELPLKDLIVVERITSPTDIANHVEGLEARRHAGKSGAFADRVHAITGRLTQFSTVIDAMTSSNVEAALIWGSLKLLLTLVHRSAEEYEKICRSILVVSESFPTVESLARTFDHSELVCSHVVAFYQSVLQFWSKAVTFYKRRRLFKFLLPWHDFDTEFGDLASDMRRHGQSIEKAALAVHMLEYRLDKTEQNTVINGIVEATRSASTSDRHRDIVKWLAPLNHEAGYFADDLRSAHDSRHPGTCMWILDKPEFEMWRNSDISDAATRMLWLTGVPGAGKTVLSSFVINRCSEVSCKQPTATVLYFFFKATDSDKNSILAVTRSLVYQLYLLFPASLSTDLVSLRDDSGKEKALSDQRLWDLFVKHAKGLANLVIVLDALDECDAVDVLLGRMITLLQLCLVKVFVVSRREEIITLALEDYPHIIIGGEDIEADIRSYVAAEVAKIPRFRGKPVQQRTINALSSGHGGMFLWAYLMIEELKELGTVKQVDDALKSLPRGLEKMHEMIITRLDASLSSAHRQLVTEILRWVVCAVRPLRLVELQEVLRFGIRENRTPGEPPFDDDDDLLYSEKDIELACGALVLTRNGTLQLIHLSTKEILTRRPLQMCSDDTRLAFYVDAQRENPHMAAICISYLSTHVSGITSLTRPNLHAVSRLQLSKESYDSTEVVRKSPFIDYASISWQAHLIDGEISLQLEDIMCRLQELLTCKLTILWIELSVSLHQDIIWTIERSCKGILSWADYESVPADSSCHEAIKFLWAWSNAVLSIVNEYGRVIERYPYEIHYLDLESILWYGCTPGLPVLPASYSAKQTQTLQEEITELRGVNKDLPGVKVEPCRQLQPNLEDPTRNYELGFLLYDSKRKVYITADLEVCKNSEVLWVQERATGRILQPVRSPLNDSEVSCQVSESPRISVVELRLNLISAVLSRDHTYLGILYSHDADFVFSTWIIEESLDFRDIRHGHSWARRLHLFRTKSSLFNGSCCPLTVGQDGFFYCPIGQIHPARGLRKEIPSSTRNRTSLQDNHAELAFAGIGQTIIRLHRRNGHVQEISWLEDTITEPWQLRRPARHGSQATVCLRAISQTARFMVYEALLNHEYSVEFYLLDRQGNLTQLQVDDHKPYASIIFHFSQDEQYLLAIYTPKPNDIRFSRWAVSKPSLVPHEETRLFVPYFYLLSGGSSGLSPIGAGVSVVEEDSMIVLVTAERVLYELDLQRLNFMEGSLATHRGTSHPHPLYCQRGYQVSSDGVRVVGFYIRCSEGSTTTTSERHEELGSPDFTRCRLELKFLDLSGTADHVQTTVLEYIGPKSPVSPNSHMHTITFSPDLSMLQAGPHIFDLSAPPHPRRLSFPDSSFEIMRLERHSQISFSSCNYYLVIIEGEGEDDEARIGCTTIRLFQLCRTAGKIEEIKKAGLDDLIADGCCAAFFHPVLPLLVATCITYREIDVKGTVCAIKVVEIDLDAFKFAQTYTREYRPAIDRDVFLEKKHAKKQIPAVWGHMTCYNSRFYKVGWHDEPTMVNLYQAIDLPHKNGLRDPIDFRRGPKLTIEVQITAFPTHLASAEVYLLVGKDGDDRARMLFLPRKGPPEIKHLRVTLNQILHKLEEAARAVATEIATSPDEFSETIYQTHVISR